jgi:predicted dehydrogenase
MASASSSNDKLNIAVIGVGGRGRANLRSVAGENIVALCDINEAELAVAAEHLR